MATLLWLQAHRTPWLDQAFTALSFLGSEPFYFLFLSFFYWCLEPRGGVRLTVILLFSLFLNGLLKDAFALPRPSHPELHPLTAAEGYGFPSGHAQGTATLWVGLFLLHPRLLTGVLAVTLPLLVGISRLYLGVHYPADVLGGWLIGSLWAGLAHLAAERWQHSISWSGRRMEFPEDGLSLLKKYAPLLPLLGALLLLLLHQGENAWRIAGTLFGAGTGFFVVRFNPRGSLLQRTLRFALGILGLVLLRELLRAPLEELLPPERAIFLRYAVLGFWVSWLGPRVFLLLRLAGREPGPRPAFMSALFSLVLGTALAAFVPLPPSLVGTPGAKNAQKPAPLSPAAEIQLVAIQMELRPEDYGTEERFRQRILGIMDEVRSRTDPHLPTLVVFPEDAGILTVLAGEGDILEAAPDLRSAVEAMIRRHAARIALVRFSHRVSWPRAIFLYRHREMARIYFRVFSEAAARYGVYLVAGSLPLPDYPLPPDGSLPDPGSARGSEVYNTSYFFGPDGRILGRQKKVHLIELEGPQGLDLTPGKVEELQVIPTPLGRVAIAICLDAFEEDVISRLKELGGEILVQPSANPAPWSPEQQRDWLRSSWEKVAQRGLFAYGVNPMLVGRVLDLGFYGQSSLLADPRRYSNLGPPPARPGYLDTPPAPGFLQVAPDPAGEAILVARVRRPSSP